MPCGDMQTRMGDDRLGLVADTSCGLHPADQPRGRCVARPAAKRKHVMQIVKRKAAIGGPAFGQIAMLFSGVTDCDALPFQP